MRLGTGVLLAVLLISQACAAPPAAQPEASERAASQAIVTSLEVKVIRDSVQLILHATNPGAVPVTLEFSSAQRYDFAVRDLAGKEVWRWSADRGFAAALGSVVLQAGETVQHREVWAGAVPGQYLAEGMIPARGLRLESRTEFQVDR